jgi:hypothetical protein
MSNEKKYPNLTLQQREENIEFVKKQIKFSGLENKETANEIEKLENSKKNDYSYKINGLRGNFGNEVEHQLNFKKAENGKVFFNSFDTQIKNKDNYKNKQTFPIKYKGITAKQSVNLLEGRSVLTTIKDFQNNKNMEAFVKLKLDDEKNKYDNFKMDITPKENVNVNNTLVGSKIKFENDDQKNKAIKSLEKGNITRVNYENGQKGLTVLNPKENKLNLYDENFKSLKFKETLQETPKKTKGVKV